MFGLLCLTQHAIVKGNSFQGLILLSPHSSSHQYLDYIVCRLLFHHITSLPPNSTIISCSIRQIGAGVQKCKFTHESRFVALTADNFVSVWVCVFWDVSIQTARCHFYKQRHLLYSCCIRGWDLASFVPSTSLSNYTSLLMSLIFPVVKRCSVLFLYAVGPESHCKASLQTVCQTLAV